MDVTSLYNEPANPFRPVDWRWRRAGDIMENDRPLSLPLDDDWVALAVRLVASLRGRQEEGAGRRLARSEPALLAAHALYAGPPSFMRAEVEARLLTEEPFALVAEKCGTTAAVVEAYESLFFCVRDRPHAGDYVLGQAVGPKAYAGLREDDVGVILKTYAHAGGPHLLDALVGYYRHPPVVPERPELLGADARKELRTKLLIKASVVARTLPVGDATLRKAALIREAVDVIRGGQVSTGGGRGALGQPLHVPTMSPEQLLELHKQAAHTPTECAEPGIVVGAAVAKVPASADLAGRGSAVAA
jgi:hypothetical protein